MAKGQKPEQSGRAFQDELLRKYFVRWHMSLILAATVASGLLIDKALLWLGFDGMGWRYALSVLGAYGFFFLLVRLWIWYAAGVPVTVRRPDFSRDAMDVAIPEFGGGDAGDGGLDLGIDVDEGSWILLVLAVLIIVVAACGGYLIWMAPEILPEVALECAVGAGLVRQLKDREAGWAGRLFGRTWIPLVFVMGMAFSAGAFIQGTCPGATHVRAALHCVMNP